MNNFYVYEHWRPDTNTCFYVGKGKGDRAYYKYDRNPHWQNIVNKLDKLGLCYEVKFVAKNLSEQEAFDLEKERIAFWHKNENTLVNMTEGGEGISNPSKELRIKMSIAKKGKTISEKHRNNISKAMKGKSKSETHRIKMRAIQKERKTRFGPLPPERGFTFDEKEAKLFLQSALAGKWR